MAYGALNQSVKKTWSTKQVNNVPKSYTETTKIADQFVEPKTKKRASVSIQTRVAFIQTVQLPPNNIEVGGDEYLK